jgi:electron transfer flavoprotein beta subunit
MKILVCVSNVPDTTSKITFSDNNTVFNSAGVQYIVNPYDEVALSKAIGLVEANGGSVTVQKLAFVKHLLQVLMMQFV